MQSDRPLLTIAVPTYKRSEYLRELLSVLVPQVEKEPSVELLISDNASPDDTAEVTERLCPKDPRFRKLRNPVNIGADANFLQCFREARGRYVWLVGDDDILVPGSLEAITRLLSVGDYDIAFVRPYAFRERFDEMKVQDRLGRKAMVVNSAARFTNMTGIMLTFISAVIVNKDRLNRSGCEDPADLIGTGLVQLGWVLPLLAEYRRGLIIYGGLVAGRRGNSGGYDHSEVFGRDLKKVAFKLLQRRPQLAQRIMNSTLRCWLPGIVLELRQKVGGAFDYRDMHASLRPTFGDNPRYWIFVYPVIKSPLWLGSLFWLIQKGIFLRAEAVIRAVCHLILYRRDQI